jgi:hypothetical protein
MATTIPAWVPHKYRDHWRRPWTAQARRSPGFRLLLARHHLLSPHFSYAEAACKDGTPIPRALRAAARNHAFKLERLRHELGDGVLPITSWYRTKAHNRAVGGAQFSKHVLAIATDIPVEFVRKHPNFDRLADALSQDGGFGQYPGGARHIDSRGTKARWSTWTPGR